MVLDVPIALRRSTNIRETIQSVNFVVAPLMGSLAPTIPKVGIAMDPVG